MEAVGKNFILILNYPIFCGIIETEIQSHEGCDTDSSPAMSLRGFFISERGENYQ